MKLGHAVKLIAPVYVKPFVKRQKNDAADAEAICEAAQRPTMRFVIVKSADAQAAAVVFRTRDLFLVRQRTQAINALRGHLAEFGVIAAKGVPNLPKLIAIVEDPGADLPEAARMILTVLVGGWRQSGGNMSPAPAGFTYSKPVTTRFHGHPRTCSRAAKPERRRLDTSPKR